MNNQRMRRIRPRRASIVPAAYQRYLRLALELPGAEVSTSYGTPAVKVRGKLLSRLRTEAEGALALRCDFIDRQVLLQASPGVFFLTNHYRDYPMILVRLEKIDRDALADVVLRGWRLVAPKKLVAEYGTNK
ncbi:MAG: hypothetical protein JOZ93_07850 [Sinobacteraceae bacterium]|nr:hypothetical protein [Nevskiaceae bacterium]